MVHGKESGLVMKLRGMRLEGTPEIPGPTLFRFLLSPTAFFSFHLKEVGVSCNHHRLPAG
jgi:hypothetical protein